jgi:DNA-binding NarL/FixJ family response regulator
VTQASVPGLSPELQARAELTDRQAECLSLHLKGASYRFIGQALDLEQWTAYGHVQRALYRLERATRNPEPEPAPPKASKRKSRSFLGPNPFV